MSIPSGWFPNPTNPEEEVFWDGKSWSGAVRPRGESTKRVDGASVENTDKNEKSIESDRPGPSDPVVTPLPATVSASKKSRLRLWVALGAIVLLLVVGGTVTAVVAQNVHKQQVAAVKAQEKKAAAAEAKHAADLAAEAKQAADLAAAQAADDAERAQRKSTVTEVEASIKKLAKEDAAKGLIDGPIIAASCNPVSGSTDDLTDITTSFDCFVANKDNGDGSQSGYFFNATVNWDTGQYTYGLGKSGS